MSDKKMKDQKDHKGKDQEKVVGKSQDVSIKIGEETFTRADLLRTIGGLSTKLRGDHENVIDFDFENSENPKNGLGVDLAMATILEQLMEIQNEMYMHTSETMSDIENLIDYVGDIQDALGGFAKVLADIANATVGRHAVAEEDFAELTVPESSTVNFSKCKIGNVFTGATAYGGYTQFGRIINDDEDEWDDDDEDEDDDLCFPHYCRNHCDECDGYAICDDCAPMGNCRNDEFDPEKEEDPEKDDAE